VNYIDLEYEYVHKLAIKFLGLPSVQALIPINPKRWPAYYAGSVFDKGIPKCSSDYFKPFTNCRAAYNYVKYGHNLTHRFRNFNQVLLDTIEVNAIATSDVPICSALAGRLANKKARYYAETFKNDWKLIDSVKQKAIATKWRQNFGAPDRNSSTIVRLRPPIGGYQPNLFIDGANSRPWHHNILKTNSANYTNYTKPGINYPSWKGRSAFLDNTNNKNFKIFEKLIILILRNKIKILLLLSAFILIYVYKKKFFKKKVLKIFKLAMSGGC